MASLLHIMAVFQQRFSFHLSIAFCYIFLTWFSVSYVNCIGEVVYAVNCGGSAHTDLNGVHYQSDKLSFGTPSDYGKNLQIGRVAPADQILYQTERYHTADFGYSIPIKDEGDFVLVLKFCEVYFRGSKLKVFDVRLNHNLVVVKDLDIYDQVGYGIAHDEYIPFKIQNGQLKVGSKSTPFTGHLFVEFIKSYYDNPKINALVVFKGNVEDVPRLQPLEQNEEEQREAEFEEELPKDKKNRKTSGPKVKDPYELDDGSYFYPFIIAVGLFIPTLLCLCKL
ncbi:malectin-A isoform X2 [Hydra vulgaris]|uniref:Malectin-A isoform X2 n=1 Tax=Hydra vulgaris TaxID=6087 RepID=A0ABM4CNP3_HYDVU